MVGAGPGPGGCVRPAVRIKRSLNRISRARGGAKIAARLRVRTAWTPIAIQMMFTTAEGHAPFAEADTARAAAPPMLSPWKTIEFGVMRPWVTMA